MEKKFKGLVAIQDVLDDRYQKLSDKYHNLELSHNRKKKCLFEILQYMKLEIGMSFSDSDVVCVPIQVFKLMNDRIESALFSDGRERERKCTTQKKDSKSCLKESRKKKKNSNK